MTIKRTWVYERRKQLISRCTFPSSILEHLLENGLLTKEQYVMFRVEQPRESKMRLIFEQLSPQNTFGLYDAIKDLEKHLFEDLNNNFKKKLIVPTPEQAAWVSNHCEKLIKMCTLPDPILDHLLDNEFLSDEQYRTARAEQSGESKMKVIFELLSPENLAGLFHAVKEEEEELFIELNKSLVQKPRIRALSPRPSEYNYMGKTPLKRVMRVMDASKGSCSKYKHAMVANNEVTSKYLIVLAESYQQSTSTAKTYNIFTNSSPQELQVIEDEESDQL